VRGALPAGFLALVGGLLLAQLGTPGPARSLSCAASTKPIPPAPVYHVELSAKQTTLDTSGSVDLFGRFRWGICVGTSPRITLEASVGGGEFARAGGVAIYSSGSPMICTSPPGVPGPVTGCAIAWDTEDLAFVAAPVQTTEYRLRVGPLVSEPIAINVTQPHPEEHCEQVPPAPERRQLFVTPERTRIVYGESVRVRGTFAYELCGRLLRPGVLTGIESRRAGERYTNQPPRHLLSGPTKEPSGDVIYELAPPETTDYRIFFASDFGDFTTVEVAPKLALQVGRASVGSVPVRVQAYATSSLVGAQVRIERRAGTGWKLLTTTTFDEDLRAFARIPKRGNVEIRAVAPATLHYATGLSSPLQVRS
jgi:hypothetical protein